MTSHGLYLFSTFIIFVLIVRGSPTYDKLISFECLYSNHFDKVRTVLVIRQYFRDNFIVTCFCKYYNKILNMAIYRCPTIY